MLQAVELASSKPLTEVIYNFLKRYTEVLNSTGTELDGFYGNEPDITKPE
jgi:hypothetical protein